MISLEIAECLSKKCKDNKQILIKLLENILEVEIRFNYSDNGFSSRYYYDYNGNDIGREDQSNTIIVMNLWKYLDDNQRQILIDTVMNMQGSKKNPVNSNKNKETNHNTINNIFIVYGHDLEFREVIKDKINAFNIEHEDKNYQKVKPVLFDDEFTTGKTIIETLEKQTEKCNYAIILLTADDEGKNKKDVELKKRARQNVILEWGWFVGTVGRENVLVLVDEDDKLELPSDVLGLKWSSKKNWRAELEKFLKHISNN